MKAVLWISVIVVSLTTKAWAMEYEVEFKQSQIQNQIDQLLPVRKQSVLANVEINAVDLTLLDRHDRVALTADLDVQTIGGFQTLAQVSMESGVRYEPNVGAFYFQNVKVLALTAEQIPASLQPQLAMLTEQVINQALLNYPIYTLDSSEVNQHLLKSSLKRIKIRDNKLIAVMQL